MEKIYLCRKYSPQILISTFILIIRTVFEIFQFLCLKKIKVYKTWLLRFK